MNRLNQLKTYKFKSPVFSALKSILIFGFLLLQACASMQSPQGGPRDTTPPKLLSVEPKSESLNFKAKKVVLHFDEYFKLSNEYKEFSVSPELIPAPQLKVRGKSLEIQMPDTLEQNTTYSFNFGNLISDVNEGNITKELYYVFSTGNTLDSLSIKGTVKDALTGEMQKEVMVFLLPSEQDSLLGKKRPTIFTTTDSAGRFNLRNLRARKYNLYALREKGADRIYQVNTDDIAFQKEAIDLNANLTDQELILFKEEAPTFRLLDRRISADGIIEFNYNQQLKDPKIEIINPADLNTDKTVWLSKTKDSVRIWLSRMDFDSVQIALKNETELLQQFTLRRAKSDQYKRVLSPTFNTSVGKINPYKGLVLSSNFPIKNFNKAKIVLLEDSIPRSNFSILKDSLALLDYRINFPWRTKKVYKLTLQEGAFEDIYGTLNKEIKSTFELDPADNYGNLAIKVQVPDSGKNYLVQFLNEKNEVISSTPIQKTETLNYNNYRGGKYFIRIVYDENKNNKWDTGNVLKREQPEKIYFIPKEMSIRPNWDRDETIDIPKLN